MTLEKTLDGLTVREGDKRKVRSTYAPRKFYDFAKSLDELGEADLSTTEGLKTYKRLTGEDPINHSFEETGLRRKAWVSGGNGDLSAYIHLHFNDLIGELDEPTQAKLAVTYCPTKESRKEDYESVRKLVAKSRRTLKEIETDPKGFIERNAGSSLMAYYLRAFSEEYLDLKRRESITGSLLAVRHYGSANFLSTSNALINKQHKGLNEERKSLQIEIDKKVDEESVRIGKMLSAEEDINIVRHLRKKMSELQNKYPDASTRDDLAGECAGLALRFLKRKYEKPKPED